MRAGAHARTVFAGFGVSSSLLAAVGAAFVVGGGVLAFDSWPASAGPAAEQTLDVARAAPSARTAPAIELPAAPAPVAAAPGAAAAPSAGALAGNAGPAGPAAPAGRVEVAPATGTAPDPGPAGTPIGTPDPAPLPVPTLGAAVATTTDGLAESVVAVGDAVPAAKPVTDLVGASLAGTGQAVGALLNGGG